MICRMTALLFAAAVGVPASVRADIAGEPSTVHAITGVTIVSEPGADPVAGTIVLRDGRIELLGAGVTIPSDAVVHARPGRTVYAGLIEPYLRLSADSADSATGGRGIADGNTRLRADVRAVDGLPVDAELLEEMRTAGYTVANVCPGSGIFRGTAAVVSLGDGDAKDNVIIPDGAQIVAFERSGWEDSQYPNSVMGSIAVQRQALYDAEWHRAAWDAWRKNGGETERPERNASLEALEPALDGEMPVFWESEDLRMLPRALRIASEFRLRPVIVSGAGDEYRRPGDVRDWLGETGAELVVSVDFPGAPEWDGPDEEVAIELDALVHWERAPTNPRELDDAGIRFSVTTQGLEKRDAVRDRLRTAIRLGLPAERALAVVTTEPARLLGIEDRVGTLAPGKAANLVVATGPLFANGTAIEEVWIDGIRYGADPRQATESDVAGEWDVTVGEGDDARRLTLSISRAREGLEGKVLPPEEENRSGDEEAAELGDVGLVRGLLRFTLDDADFALELDGELLTGTAGGDGEEKRVVARKPPHRPDEPDDLWTVYSETAPAWPPRADEADAPRAVLVRHATIWTCGPDGVLEDADMVVADGRIQSVGTGLSAPTDALVIDATGKQVTPGLIDCHSHSSISGGVNECTHSATAEVRIADVINPWSRAMYRELAGGLTVSNLLHGSCNAIGGQNAVIKLRWGAPAKDLLFADAPQGIKFALGENVKQSNWDLEDGERTRYPQTRMGVEQFIRERFDAALTYRHEWDSWKAGGKRGAPPRRDLQLDALLEILDGERLVHCHSYRADEIIMLIRIADDYGFRLGTFQHVLEGYKCANEMAEHGAGASTFSDWWSYKYEVVDAIPYNGEIMWRRGVTVSFNSDSSELSRRMNLEAAKAVKYGGVPEEEALDFVTRNPAVQLGVDEWVGSLERGKHADFVLWSGHPLSDTTICEQTWIDGVRRFSRAKDLAARAGAAGLRAKLLAKARALNRIHDLDPSVGDKGSMPARAFGRRWGASEEEAGVALARGHCRVEGGR